MSKDNQDQTIELELRFFASFRNVVGQKVIHRVYPHEMMVGDVLAAIESEFPDLNGDIIDSNGDIQPQLTVLKNGHSVMYLNGTDTELADGDEISFFPPIAGG